MNNFKKSIDKIEIDKTEKAKILDNIMNKRKKEKKGFSQFAFTLCTIFIAFTLFCGSGYAIVRYLKIDQIILDYLHLNNKDAEKLGIDGNEENITKNYENLSLTIKNTVFDNNNIIIMIDVKNPTNKEFRKAHLSLGDKYDIEKGFGGIYSFDQVKKENNITTYIYKQSLNTTINKGNMTLSLLECLDEECEKNNIYDITFPIKYSIQNNKEYIDKNNTLLFKGIDEENKETYITLDKIFLSPLSTCITIKNSDVKNYEFNLNNGSDKINAYLVYNNNTKVDLAVLANNIYSDDKPLENSTIIDLHYEFNNPIDTNNIRSIIINNIEFTF